EEWATPGFVWAAADVNDAQLIEWRNEMAATVDYDERTAILKKMNERFLDLAGCMTFASPYSYIYCWPWVENWWGETSTGNRSPQLAYVPIWINQTLKTEMGY
ncbi:hypothetical protein ACFLU0_01860, partial [Chloroflexota bacterium]